MSRKQKRTVPFEAVEIYNQYIHGEIDTLDIALQKREQTFANVTRNFPGSGNWKFFQVAMKFAR